MESCGKCHFKGNQVGAASMVLPAKSILCLPCHAATLSVGDTTTILALIIFIIGIAGLFSYWFSGSMSDEIDHGPINKFFRLLGNMIKAVLSKKI